MASIEKFNNFNSKIVKMKFKVKMGENPFRKENKKFKNYSDSQESIVCSKENPYTIAVLNWDGDGGEEIGINCYVEIYEPFTRYVNDEYDVTEYIEFNDGDFYRCIWLTPMESQSFKVNIDDMYLTMKTIGINLNPYLIH
jgi:hypothetical protein